MPTTHPVRPLPRGSAPSRRPRLSCPEVFESIRCESLGREDVPIEAIGPDELLGNALGHMWWGQIGALPVVERERLVGCIGEDDLLRVCAERARALESTIDEQGDDLGIWETLLADLRARDAMTEIAQLALVHRNASLLEGLRSLDQATRTGTMQRHILVTDESQRLVRIVSIRDIGRRFAQLYEDERADAELTGALQPVLDVPVGEYRAVRDLGHAPVLASAACSGAETLARMREGRRGYLLVTFDDGGPRGICTRRDVLRALKNPYAHLGDFALARLMTGRVECASPLTTLGGVFRLMAIGGYRHMPLLDARQQVERVVSMAEAVTVLAQPGNA